MNLWTSLVSENPMLIEVRRYRRRLLGGGRATGTSVAFLTLGAVCYLGLLLIVGNGNGSIPPIAIVIIQTGVFTIAAPIVLNNAIAGEREKRTWDLLLVAPVTKAQIMIGKFAGAMTNLLLAASLFLLPIFICAASFDKTNGGKLFLAEVDSIAFAVFACTITIFFSARCKRGFSALGMSLGVLILGLVVYPILVGSLGGLDPVTRDFAFIIHPFVVQFELLDGIMDNSTRISATTNAITQIVLFSALSAVLLVWTERTLTFSDNEVKFLPKKHA